MPLDLDNIDTTLEADKPERVDVEPKLDDKKEEEKVESTKNEVEGKEEEGSQTIEEDEENTNQTGEGDSEDEEGEEAQTLTQVLLQQSGFDFGDEEFEDTAEGYSALTDAIADKKLDQKIQSLRETNPIAADFYDHISKGGDPSRFQEVYSSVDYDTIEVGEDDVQQMEIIRHRLVADGYSDENVTRSIERYKTNGTLKEEAEVSLSRLQNIQKDQRQSLIQETEERNRLWEKEQKEYITDTTAKISKSSDISGLPITDKDKPGFIKFVTDVDPKTGTTPYARSVAEMTDEQVLMVQYLAYKGMKLDSLVKNMARSSQAKSLTEMAERSKLGVGGRREERRRSVSSVDTDDLVIDPT